MGKKKRELFHTDFVREDTRHKNNSGALNITNADLYLMQAFGRIQ